MERTSDILYKLMEQTDMPVGIKYEVTKKLKKKKKSKKILF